MEVIPAIDLRRGRCVRLYQGDYAQEQVFSDDPVSVALRWQQEGAPRLHLVDLDGAVEGYPANFDALRRIAEGVTVPLQVGGGVRTVATVERLLGIGVERVVLGTAAVEEPELVRSVMRQIGEDRVVVAVDSKDGKVAVRGWHAQSSLDALTLVDRMEALGVRHFVFTDISRDGTLSEPNFSSIAQVAARAPGRVIASGGISRQEHLVRLAGMGLSGCIVGKALYTGAIRLPEALAAVAKASRT